ncbi:hypothetical protein EVG20_g10768, partial [Dentipellis fragilis]
MANQPRAQTPNTGRPNPSLRSPRIPPQPSSPLSNVPEHPRARDSCLPKRPKAPLPYIIMGGVVSGLVLLFGWIYLKGASASAMRSMQGIGGQAAFNPKSDSGPQNSTAPTDPARAKVVVAHFMVGNTFPYTVEDWKRDMVLAANHGIDAFALNFGRDEWQRQRLDDAYAAALELSHGPWDIVDSTTYSSPSPSNSSSNATAPDTHVQSCTPGPIPFKLFLSLDMSSLPCASDADAAVLQALVERYAAHPAQLLYNGTGAGTEMGRAVLSTFAGARARLGRWGGRRWRRAQAR